MFSMICLQLRQGLGQGQSAESFRDERHCSGSSEPYQLKSPIQLQHLQHRGLIRRWQPSGKQGLAMYLAAIAIAASQLHPGDVGIGGLG
jgi:hypothetical protein